MELTWDTQEQLNILAIRKATKLDAGSYVVHAHNESGSESYTVSVVVVTATEATDAVDTTPKSKSFRKLPSELTHSSTNESELTHSSTNESELTHSSTNESDGEIESSTDEENPDKYSSMDEEMCDEFRSTDESSDEMFYLAGEGTSDHNHQEDDAFTIDLTVAVGNDDANADILDITDVQTHQPQDTAFKNDKHRKAHVLGNDSYQEATVVLIPPTEMTAVESLVPMSNIESSPLTHCDRPKKSYREASPEMVDCSTDEEEFTLDFSTVQNETELSMMVDKAMSSPGSSLGASPGPSLGPVQAAVSERTDDFFTLDYTAEIDSHSDSSPELEVEETSTKTKKQRIPKQRKTKMNKRPASVHGSYKGLPQVRDTPAIPRVVMPLQPVIVSQGETIQLICQIEGCTLCSLD